MKKKHPEHVNLERWLVSYADFITLLFAFFVVLFSSAQVDQQIRGMLGDQGFQQYQDYTRNVQQQFRGGGLQGLQGFRGGQP